jgi:hypothetical protein
MGVLFLLLLFLGAGPLHTKAETHDRSGSEPRLQTCLHGIDFLFSHPCCVTLGPFPRVSVCWFPVCKVEMVLSTVPLGCWEDPRRPCITKQSMEGVWCCHGYCSWTPSLSTHLNSGLLCVWFSAEVWEMLVSWAFHEAIHKCLLHPVSRLLLLRGPPGWSAASFGFFPPQRGC